MAKHDYSKVFDTDNELWQRVLEIYEANEKFPKKIVSGRNLHHKFPRSFSKKLGEDVDNDKDNLVSLSLSDHFLIHYYYYKLARTGYKQSMAMAFNLMAKKQLKYVSPETAESMAKDYEEAMKLSTNKGKKFGPLSKEVKDRMSLSHKGHKHSLETREKMSISGKKASTPELRKLRSESRKGEPHPHKSGRKGLPSSEFGKLFYEHYGFTSSGHAVIYRKELHYWREHHKCSWDN